MPDAQLHFSSRPCASLRPSNIQDTTHNSLLFRIVQPYLVQETNSIPLLVLHKCSSWKLLLLSHTEKRAKELGCWLYPLELSIFSLTPLNNEFDRSQRRMQSLPNKLSSMGSFPMNEPKVSCKNYIICFAHFATSPHLACDAELSCQRDTSKEKGQPEALNQVYSCKGKLTNLRNLLFLPCARLDPTGGNWLVFHDFPLQ